MTNLTIIDKENPAVQHQIQINLTNNDINKGFKGHKDRLADRTKMLLVDSPEKERRTSTVINTGITCKFYYTDFDPNLSTKKKQIAEAIKNLSKGGATFRIPNNKMPIYCTTKNPKPGGSLTYFSNASVGFVYKDNDLGPKIATLILGDSIAEKAGLDLVANHIYDYYKPTWTINAFNRRAMTNILHEFGHIYHQLLNEDHYFSLVRVKELSNQNDATAKTFITALNKYAETISGYATNHPNEFIAETFAALMLGAPVAADVVNAYTALGGPQIQGGMAHVRKRK